MNRGVMLKAALEVWPGTLMCGLLLAGVEVLMAYVLPTFQAQFSNGMLQVKFMQQFVGAMLGVGASDQLGPEAFQAFPWVHPVVLALVWTHALLCTTRVPAGEIDRGTVDLLFTLPVSRWNILISETLVWLAAGAVMLALGLAGNYLGSRYVEPDLRPDFARQCLVVANLACLYLAVGGFACLVSAASNRRGPALVLIFVALLASFLLNFLGQFWKFAERIAFLGILDYFRPLYILRDGTIPWGNMGVLLGLAAVCWIAAGVMLNRRDICTV